MPRKPPPTIYTCISEPDKNGIRVIRYSADPEALDSLPTMFRPPPELVSKSRVVYQYEDDLDLLFSCRGAIPPGFGAGSVIGDDMAAMNYLICSEPPHRQKEEE